jgi:hypothetical protein
MSTYTPERGVVRHQKILDAVSNNDEGESFAMSRDYYIAGASKIAVQLEGRDITTTTATLRIRTSIDGGETWRLHKYIIDTTGPTNGMDYTDSILIDADGRIVGFLAPETVGPITHLKAELEITGADGTANFDVIFSAHYK